MPAQLHRPRSAVTQQRSWDEHGRYGVRAGGGTQSAVGGLPMSDGRNEDLPAHSDPAERADQSRTALLGDQMGLPDPL